MYKLGEIQLNIINNVKFMKMGLGKFMELTVNWDFDEKLEFGVVIIMLVIPVMDKLEHNFGWFKERISSLHN